MKNLSHNVIRTIPMLLIFSIVFGVVSCADKKGKGTLSTNKHENIDSCNLKNTMLSDMYLGIDINSDYSQVLVFLDSLAQDSIVSSVKCVDKTDLNESELNVGLKEYNKSIFFNSYLSLRNEGKYEITSTSCKAFFFENKLYAIEVYPFGADSIQISDVYIEKYGKPNMPTEKSIVNRYPKNIRLFDYSDTYFRLINMQYHTITDWKFKNAVIRLLVIHENEHIVEFDGKNLDYALKTIDSYHIRNDAYTESDMFKIFQYCKIEKERDIEHSYESIFYINDNVQKIIETNLARKEKLKKDSIERVRKKEQLEERHRDSIKAKEAEKKFKQQII